MKKKTTIIVCKSLIYTFSLVAFFINYSIADGFLRTFWGYDMSPYRGICKTTYIVLGVFLIISMSIEMFRGMFKKE